VFRELRLRRRPQLYRLLQSGIRQAGGAAVTGGRSRETATTGVADGTALGRGPRPPDHLLYPRRQLLAAPREGADDHGQQPVQRLALRGSVAGPIGWCLANIFPVVALPGCRPV